MKKTIFILSCLIFISFGGNAQSSILKINEAPLSTSNSEKVKIEVWSDVSCPFCFLGKKKLAKAIKKLNAQDKVEIIWRSFQLDPDFPKDTSILLETFLVDNKYTLDEINGMSASLTNQGQKYGIDFQFEKAMTFNTLDIHRLIQWSKQFNKSSDLKEAFMVAHFTDGLDLSKHKDILNVVNKVGLDPSKAESILNSNAYLQAFEEDITKSEQLNIQGVPYFLINDNEVIYGAEDDSVFEKVISKVIEK